MSLNFFNVVDALQVWDNVKDSVKASIAVTKNRDQNSLDYSFITPTLLGNEGRQNRVRSLQLGNNESSVPLFSEHPSSFQSQLYC